MTQHEAAIERIELMINKLSADTGQEIRHKQQIECLTTHQNTPGLPGMLKEELWVGNLA